MMGPLQKRIASACLVAGAFCAIPNAAHACAVCFGAADSTQTAGMNMAMVTLLGVTGTVFCGLIACLLTFRRRVMAIEREAACAARSEIEDRAVEPLCDAEDAPSDEGLREDAMVE